MDWQGLLGKCSVREILTSFLFCAYPACGGSFWITAAFVSNIFIFSFWGLDPMIRGLDRWSLEVCSHPYNSVILWFSFTGMVRPKIAKWVGPLEYGKFREEFLLHSRQLSLAFCGFSSSPEPLFFESPPNATVTWAWLGTMGSQCQKVTGLLIAAETGKRAFLFHSSGTTCNKYSFWGGSSQVIALVHDVQDVSEPLLIMTMSTHHAANIPPTLERQPQQKNKTENAFLKAYVEFTLRYNWEWCILCPIKPDCRTFR